MRVKAVIAYDGSHFYGFQRQSTTKRTIEGQIEEVLETLEIHTQITGSGRTDSGVHASGQVIHFDLPPFWNDTKRLTTALNRKLTHIRFKHIYPVDDTFHARFSAKSRLYRYLFKTSTPSVFEEKYVSYYPPFDPVLLTTALKQFKGEHDFEYFQKTGTETHTTIRNIIETKYVRRKNYHLIYFRANGFLRSQVRMMIEAAMQCATGEMSLVNLKEQIDKKKRTTTRLAPPEGLYLARIVY